MAATAVLPLAHAPPVALIDNVVVLPWQAEAPPVIASGRACTVTTIVLKHVGVIA